MCFKAIHITVRPFFIRRVRIGADIRSVCTEAGMYSIRARRKVTTFVVIKKLIFVSNCVFSFLQSISERDLVNAISKVVKGYKKFSATPKYMVYN